MLFRTMFQSFIKLVPVVFEQYTKYVHNCGVTIVGDTTLGCGGALTRSLYVQKN